MKVSGMARVLRIAILLTGLFAAKGVLATTYYVDYANGLDTNNGTSKLTPWKRAPGMNGATGNTNSITPVAGDNVIFKGCVTWPNATFSWFPQGNGSSGNPIYYGVDVTWWDNTVTGCASSWNRPTFNLGNAAPTDNSYRIIFLGNNSYITLDNFEITNVACLPSPGNGSTDVFDWGGPGNATGVTVKNMYVHGWNNPVFSVGTGNTTSGSYSITNFVPFSYSPQPSSSWVSGIYAGQVRLQTIPCCTSIPAGNGSPTLTAISGSNPYTLTFSNTGGPATSTVTGAVIQVGGSWCNINGGAEGAETQSVFTNNVIDGSDTAEVQLNPYGDCGLTEGNNNFCIGSATVGWRQPNIYRNNVMRFVSNIFIGGCQEWSGNLAEYVRLPTDPTGHTNGIECLDAFPVNGVDLFYNNVFRHMNNPNPNVPGGRWSVGAAPFWVSSAGPSTAYVFNNVAYDAIQNKDISRDTSAGTMIVFNNTFACGNDWAGYAFPCSDVQPSDVFQNNLAITSNSTPWGSGATYKTNILWTSSQATKAGYMETEAFAYAPQNSNCSGMTPCTVSAGTSNVSFCNAINAAGFTAAYQACMADTGYGASYNSVHHAVAGPARASSSWNGSFAVGAYLFGGGTSSQVQPPSGLVATVQ
jgi:hypothetical protein